MLVRPRPLLTSAGRPLPPGSALQLREGDSARLSCSAARAFPQPEVAWLHTGPGLQTFTPEVGSRTGSSRVQWG